MSFHIVNMWRLSGEGAARPETKVKPSERILYELLSAEDYARRILEPGWHEVPVPFDADGDEVRALFADLADAITPARGTPGASEIWALLREDRMAETARQLIEGMQGDRMPAGDLIRAFVYEDEEGRMDTDFKVYVPRACILNGSLGADEERMVPEGEARVSRLSGNAVAAGYMVDRGGANTVTRPFSYTFDSVSEMEQRHKFAKDLNAHLRKLYKFADNKAVDLGARPYLTLCLSDSPRRTKLSLSSWFPTLEAARGYAKGQMSGEDAVYPARIEIPRAELGDALAGR